MGSPLTAAVSTNDQLCASGVEALADSLTMKISLDSISAVTVVSVEGRFGKQLLDRMLSRLGSVGTSTYLQTSEVGSQRPLLQATVDENRLSYKGINSGLFSSGKVLREFRISGSCRLLQSDGKLIRTSVVKSLAIGDTLSFNDSRLAWGNDPFLCPELPPSLYQRLVEPGLILGITGVLIYLFFASR